MPCWKRRAAWMSASACAMHEKSLARARIDVEHRRLLADGLVLGAIEPVSQIAGRIVAALDGAREHGGLHLASPLARIECGDLHILTDIAVDAGDEKQIEQSPPSIAMPPTLCRGPAAPRCGQRHKAATFWAKDG